MLLVEHPAGYAPERDYIFRVMLGEFLGLDYRTVVADRPDVRITDGSERSSELRIADSLFQTSTSDWLTPASLPHEPLENAVSALPSMESDRVPTTVPVIYGRRLTNGAWARATDRSIELGLDIFGGAFFMLTRYEEMVVRSRDRHDRFPAIASLAYRQGFLQRPVVNEYLELLWASLSRLFPELARSPRRPKMNLTFDVDWPAITLGVSPPLLIRAAVADVIRRREPMLAARRLASWPQVRRGALDRDAGNIFNGIMSTAEGHDLRATFYFIAGDGLGDIDGAYTVEQPWIRRLLREIHARGHHIGLHPTYRTYRDGKRIGAELERLQTVCAQEGIRQSEWGGRQHYLRWEAPVTWQHYADAGLDYDSTLSYADHVGFRCGTCYAYPVFNLESRQSLNLRERPLLAMDATMFGEPGKDGMDLRPAAAVEQLGKLYAATRRYDGDFTVLWHNNWLLRSRVGSAYRDSLKLIGGGKRSEATTRLTEVAQW